MSTVMLDGLMIAHGIHPLKSAVESKEKEAIKVLNELGYNVTAVPFVSSIKNAFDSKRKSMDTTKLDETLRLAEEYDALSKKWRKVLEDARVHWEKIVSGSSENESKKVDAAHS